jgi:hypothetical protein
MLLNAIAPFNALNPVFMASSEIGQRRKSGHQIVHGSSLLFHVAGQIVNALFETLKVGGKDFDVAGQRLMPFCQPSQPFIDVHPLRALLA